MYEQTHFLSRDILHKQLQLLFQNVRIQMRLKPSLNQCMLDLHPTFFSLVGNDLSSKIYIQSFFLPFQMPYFHHFLAESVVNNKCCSNQYPANNNSKLNKKIYNFEMKS